MILLILATQVAMSAFQLASSVRPSWEYTIRSIPDRDLTLGMEYLGEEGWELVFARRAVGDDEQAAYEMIFRRAKGSE